jgi:sugar lactone lactonase YvrE
MFQLLSFPSRIRGGVLLCSALGLFAVAAAAQTITTIGGNGIQGYAGDGGPARQAEFNGPFGLAIDVQGNVYVGDQFNHVVRRIEKSGIVTTVAGTGQAGSSGDGGPATRAQLNYPNGLALDRTGNLYICDFFSENVRRVDRVTGMISTVAGTGSGGFSGDGGPATSAQLDAPTSIAFDHQQNLYIGDAGNQRVRRVDHKTGIITTVVGNGTSATSAGSGEGGPATQAGFAYFIYLAFDPANVLYVVDSGLSNVRRVDPKTNIISTVAGENDAYPSAPPRYGYSGDGGPAKQALFSNPTQIAFDCAGNLYISDSNNNRIRRVDGKTGIVTTVIGNGQQGFSGDGGNPTKAELSSPSGLAFANDGTFVFADVGNSRIRQVTDLSKDEHLYGCSAYLYW